MGNSYDLTTFMLCQNDVGRYEILGGTTELPDSIVWDLRLENYEQMEDILDEGDIYTVVIQYPAEESLVDALANFGFIVVPD